MKAIKILYDEISYEQLEKLKDNTDSSYVFIKLENDYDFNILENASCFITNKKRKKKDYLLTFLKDINITIIEMENDILKVINFLNHNFFKKENKSNKYIETLKVFNLMKNIIDNTNHYEVQHSIRVAHLSKLIGEEYNLNEDDLYKLYFGALFHDVGKINFPKELFENTNELTKEEKEIVKKHPIIGSQLVQKELSNIILCHHERLDGSGYPQGLKAENIPFESKVIAITDSFDAMCSKRSYNKLMKPKEAIKELTLYTIDINDGGKGIIFDKEILEALKKVIDS